MKKSSKSHEDLWAVNSFIIAASPEGLNAFLNLAPRAFLTHFSHSTQVLCVWIFLFTMLTYEYARARDLEDEDFFSVIRPAS